VDNPPLAWRTVLLGSRIEIRATRLPRDALKLTPHDQDPVLNVSSGKEYIVPTKPEHLSLPQPQ